MKRCLLLLSLAATAFCGSPLSAQVTVAPTILTLRDRARIGSFLVNNQSNETQQVTIEFRFGFAVTDSMGGRSMQYGDSIAGAESSMRPWLRAFPRRFNLPPGEQQLVRLVSAPPAGLPAGTYWTRLVTTSTPAKQPDTTARAMEAQLILNMEQVTTVLYRQGEVSAGIEAGPMRVARAGNTTALLLPLRRTGNAPYLGTFVLRVLDAAGKTVAQDTTLDGVYFELLRRYEIPTSQLPPGTYTYEFEAQPGRSDIPRADQIPGTPLKVRGQFTIT